MLSKSIFLQPCCAAIRMLFTTTTTLLPPFLYLFTFVCLSSSSSCCAFTQRVAAKNKMIRCIERERLALLDFKQGLLDEYGVLSSWGSDDNECCNWWGVHCNNSTGHVTMLDLHAHLPDYSDYNPIYKQLRGHKVSPSLLELEHLNYLDLSYNDFQGSRIPKFIGSFKRLRVLSLMDAEFIGTIPPQLGNLTNLRVLNISGDYLNVKLKIKNLEWLSLLSSLRSIKLGGFDIDLIESSKTSVTLPPFLEELHLPGSRLYGSLPFSLNSSSPFLSVVDFSYSSINTSWVFPLLRNASKKLTSLDLSGNYFADTIPDHAFGDMENLENLYLDSIITDGILKSFWNLTHLRILSLRENNQLNESIAELFQKLPNDAEKSLQILDLSGSKFTGELPADLNTRFTSLRELRAPFNQLNGSNFRLPSSLEYLDLSNNQITGQIPNLSHALTLRVLDLSENQLQGGLPETIGKLSKLNKLYASSNSLEGVVTEAHFSNLTHLQELELSFNVAMSFNMSSNWVPPFQLYRLLLANCKMGPQFPKWLHTQNKIVELDISSSDISDIIPN